MAPQLTGLLGINGYIITDPEATPEQIHGGYVDPAHAQWGEVAQPYSWQKTQYGYQSHGPYGPQNGLLEDEAESRAALAAGTLDNDPTADRVPYYGHAAPWPKNNTGDGSVSPDNVGQQRAQSRDIHAVNLGASMKQLYKETMEANNDQWRDYDSVDPGTSLYPHGVPASVAMTAGFSGVNDHVTNPLAKRNGYGFDSAHLHRREAIGSIPGNYMWMKPGSRPMVRSNTGLRNFPTGPDSPFEGDNPTDVYGLQGAILTQPASEYVAPPQPYTAPATPVDYGGGNMDVDWSGF